MWTELQNLRRALGDLRNDTPEDEQASFELAHSARDFSRRTKEEVDDKLSFSAVLMRAGEVDAANRLIDELERDVRAEEAALMEQVNEVRIARTMRRDQVTRARLARVLVTAVIGAGMMASSAIGMAVVGMFSGRDRVSFETPPAAGAGPNATARGDASGDVATRVRRKMKKVRIADTEVLLSAAQLRMLEKITSGAGDGADVEQLLRQLQLPPELTAEVRQVLTATVAAIRAPKRPTVELPAPNPAEQAKKKAKKKAKKQKEAQANPNPNPSPNPPQPNPDPSPSPSPDDEGDSAGGGEPKEDRDSGLGGASSLL
ncbi:MAG TPA: hypothetical protein VM784_02830 [Actinomycetota bacterium]|nr:hypothetical protein [Actinomycetota bacterium]